jgi:hypothetical protein
MPAIEIDEAEFLRLQKLNNFSHAMLQNPEAAKLLEKAAKIVDPSIKTPRLDQEAAIATPMQKMEAEMAALRKDMADRDAAVTQNQTLQALGQKRDEGIRELRRTGWTDEGIKAVEKLMDEKGLLDPLDAAAIHEKYHPPQSPAMPGSSGGWNFAEQLADDSDADLKKLIETRGESDAVTDHIARKALTEIRSQARR